MKVVGVSSEKLIMLYMHQINVDINLHDIIMLPIETNQHILFNSLPLKMNYNALSPKMQKIKQIKESQRALKVVSSCK